MTRAFFDLKVWQKAQELASQVYQITKVFPKDEIFGLTMQLRRSAVSVEANIAESHGRYHPKDKIRVLYIARAEIFEIESHLRIALDQKYLSEKNFKIIDESYNGLAIGLNCMISGLAKKS
ncbi:MAG: four helix bundle protein [Patescibacteria group bacterium]